MTDTTHPDSRPQPQPSSETADTTSAIQPETAPATAPPTEAQEGQPPAVEGVAELPTEDLIPSGEALRILLETDPLKLTKDDPQLDQIIAFERYRKRQMKEGLIKKGVKKTKAPSTETKSAVSKRKKAIAAQTGTDEAAA